MKSLNLIVITAIIFMSYPINAFEFKGVKSGMTSEDVSLITGADSSYSLSKQEAENWLNKTGYTPSTISEGVSFNYGHDGKLFGMEIKFSLPNMFMRGRDRDLGRDLFYSEVCNDGYEVVTERYDNSQYIKCSFLDAAELERSVKYYRDEYKNLVLSN